MKVSGGTTPSNGSVQRERASKPSVASLENWIRVWYSKCRSPIAETRCDAFCGAGADGDMVLRVWDESAVCQALALQLRKRFYI